MSPRLVGSGLAAFCGVLLMSVTPAPAVDVYRQFTGLTFTDSFTGGSTPPDPHGAAGPNGILATVNLAIGYYPKVSPTNGFAYWKMPLGTNLVAQGTNSFWAPNPGFSGGGPNRNELADPKVAYDLDSQRFFVVMQENVADQAFLNVAVSKNSDPQTPTTADWYFYRWDVTERWTFPLYGEVETGIDYPGLSVDRRSLVVTFKAFTLDEVGGLQGNTDVGSRAYVFDKRKLMTGLGDTPRVWRNQVPLELPLNFNQTTVLQPAQPLGDADPGNRIFLVELHLKFPYFTDNWSIRLHTINDPLGEFNHQDEDIDIDRPNGDPAGVPQPGGAVLLDPKVKRLISAVFFNGRIWTVYTQQGDRGNTVIHWVCVEPRVGQSVLIADGYFDDGPALWNFMPSIGGSGRGDLCIVYTQSGTNQVPRVLARVRNQYDNDWRPPVVVAVSSNAAVATLRSGTSYARWGDYASVTPDPKDGTLWVTHEFVPSTTTNDWATIWAQLITCNFPQVAWDFQDKTNLSACGGPEIFSAGVADLFDNPVPLEAVSYKWLHNDAPVTDTNRYRFASNTLGGTLTVLNAGFADEGWYDVVVRNDCQTNYETRAGSSVAVVGQQPTAATVDGGVQPFNRLDHRMSFARRRVGAGTVPIVALFGGEVYDPARGRVVTSDFWAWDGAWTPLATSNRPPPRIQCGLSYDQARDRLVLFGGSFYNGLSNVVYGDTWEWDGTDWQQRFPSSSPPARAWPMMAFDTAQRVTLLAGGDLTEAADRNKTWAWDGTNWTVVSSYVPARDDGLSPYEVYARSAMGYDERHHAMVRFGPFFGSGNRVWYGDAMIKPVPYSEVYASLGVIDSRGGTAFYDPGKGLVGLVGASASPNYLYYWKPDSAGAAPSFFVYPITIDGQPGSLPSGAQAGFNPATRSLVIFGGGAFFNEPPQTRVMVMQDAPVILQQPTNVVVMPGTTAVLRAAVSGGRDGLSFQWQRNDQPVSNDARILGANTPALRFQPAQASDTGTYQLVAMNSCATVTSAAARLAVGPILDAARLGGTLQLTWTATGVIVEEATDLAGPWTSHADWTSPWLVPIGNGSHFFRLKTTGP